MKSWKELKHLKGRNRVWRWLKDHVFKIEEGAQMRGLAYAVKVMFNPVGWLCWKLGQSAAVRQDFHTGMYRIHGREVSEEFLDEVMQALHRGDRR